MRSSLKNFGFKRKSGILMPISSLPSKYGIGSFGESAYKFADFLVKTGTKCWQVLPMNPTSYGDSPYQSPASVAKNPYFIDLDTLCRKGLLTKEQTKAAEHNTDFVDYGYLFDTRYSVLRLAYAEFVNKGLQNDVKYRNFVKKNKSWIDDYSLFMSLKVRYDFRPWTEWDAEHKSVTMARLIRREFADECAFWSWIQFELDEQWRALTDYAHERGILIIGDIPIYVAHDSMDVWQAPEQFLLDEDFMPRVVAGCPPDDFSPDGQLWGNPIYNWDRMESDGFEWWCKRIERALETYDIVRIDHFRGFAGYYSIPYGDETAKDGFWSAAPGVKLFRTVKERVPKARIIAEDLGFITDDVRELLSDTGFPGMKMLQFAFYNDDNEYLPRLYPSDNCVVYPGSHDADCIRSWCSALPTDARRRFRKECPRDKSQSRTYDLIELALSSRANLAVVPMQDYLELKNEEGRMNTPSVPYGNWTWRLNPRYCTRSLIEKVKSLTEKTNRSTLKI